LRSPEAGRAGPSVFRARPRGYANGVALSKADDRAGGDAKEVAPVVTSNGEENEVATLIKAAQANPIRLA
jgi:hypothetical protein